MTREDIIQMAREIATKASKVGPYRTWTHDHAMTRIMYLIDASAAAEREACAKVCDELSDEPLASTGQQLALDIASDLIRARGQA